MPGAIKAFVFGVTVAAAIGPIALLIINVSAVDGIARGIRDNGVRGWLRNHFYARGASHRAQRSGIRNSRDFWFVDGRAGAAISL